MKDRSLPRVVLVASCLLLFIAVLVVNALAGAGRGESARGRFYRYRDDPAVSR